MSMSLFPFKIFFHSFKNENMLRIILYIIAVLLVIGWVLGYFIYSLGGLIHILLILAVISIIMTFIKGDSANI